METLAVCGRSPCVSNKLCSVAESNGSSSYAQTLCLATQHLSAFNASSLRCFSPPRCYAKLRHRSSKPHIFLPHLVASMETVEETYIMIKPDGVQRGLVGEVISRFEKKGFILKGLKLFECPKELAEEHYRDLKSKPFFPKLIDYITSGPVVCMVWEGVGVVASARKIIGVTNPLQAEPGTIRGDLAVQTGRNVVHGSDSPENGQREIFGLAGSVMFLSLNKPINTGNVLALLQPSGSKKVKCASGLQPLGLGSESDLHQGSHLLYQSRE